MARMIGRICRVCDDKFCTCNPGGTKERRQLKRIQKRRERRIWAIEARD